MSTKNKGFARTLFGTAPEDGAQLAEFADTLIPGGRGFVQQLFRAKKDVLKGISHLVEAQINELEQIDSTIQDRAQQAPVPPGQTEESRPSMRVSSVEEILQKAGDLFLTKKRGSDARQPIPTSPKPSEARAPLVSGGGSGDSSGPSAPEKISIS